MSKSKDQGFVVFNEEDSDALGAYFAGADSLEDAEVHAARLNGRSGQEEPLFGVAKVVLVKGAKDIAPAPERPESDNDAEIRRLAEGGSLARDIDKKANK